MIRWTRGWTTLAMLAGAAGGSSAGAQLPDPTEGVSRFVDAAMQNNVRLDFYIHPTGQHGFDFANRDERTREIIAATVAFVTRHTAR